jgi:ATP-dependent Zn protease
MLDLTPAVPISTPHRISAPLLSEPCLSGRSLPVRSPEEWVRIARHEAGHAIVAHVLGATVTHVSILPDGEAGGHVDYRNVFVIEGPYRARGEYFVEEIERRTMISLAGGVAENRRWSYLDELVPWETEEARDLIRQIDRFRVEERLRELSRRTEELLAANHDHFAAVACALLDQHELDRRSFLAVLAEVDELHRDRTQLGVLANMEARLQ